MTSARTTTIVLGCALLTTWLVSAAVTRRPSAPPAFSAPAAADAVAGAADDLQIQSRRLRARLESVPVPRRSPRNPFRFGLRAERPAAEPRRPLTIEAAAVENSQATTEAALVPALRLVGIAAERTAVGLARTAAISVGGEIVLARVGDEVAGRYRVSAISDDVVELADRSGGSPVRLALR